MKVVLLKNIPSVGKQWEVKEVAPGFARNYLIPRGLAKVADEQSMAESTQKKELEVKQAEEDLMATQELASQLDGLEVVIPVKVTEDGTIFGSVNNVTIAEALAKLGFPNILKQQVILKEPIKEVGEYAASVAFKHNLEADIKLVIVSES